MILIKPVMEKSFAEVVSDIEAKTNPEDSVTEVKCIRCTKSDMSSLN